MYNKKPKMILFDVGGTLFNDGKCIAEKGFFALLKASENPDVTNEKELSQYWDEYMNEVCKGLKSKSGITLDAPLSAIIKYATMNTGLHIDLPVAQQEELFDRFNSTRTVIDGVPELFEALEKLNIRYAIISNNAMSGEGLALSIKQWIPSISPEFCLTSADLMFTKPSEKIFVAASNYAHLKPEECWYCGDGKIPDVDGAQGVGMVPVLLDEKSEIPLEFREDGIKGEYITVNNWNVLNEYLKTI
ncbi:MAG: HAD hydrolase-like protein [Clostridia bacterium]|nr:HAD hydrolase-like protein [Clostridia bacterium]